MVEVCVDASLTLKLVLEELGSEQVRRRWADWINTDTQTIAPWLWSFETHSVLRRKVARQELTDHQGQEAWRTLRQLSVRIVHPRALFERAWAIAAEFRRPTTYDTVYVAAAELRRCDLWTADQRLLNAVSEKLGWIRSIYTV